MDWGRYLKVWKDHWLKIGPLLIVASAQAEVITWPLTGSAGVGGGALGLKWVNNLLQISFAARRFATDSGHLPSSLPELAKLLDSPQPTPLPATCKQLPPASLAPPS